MELTPQDLGEKWRVALLARRSLARVRRVMGAYEGAGEAAEQGGVDRVSRLSRHWLRTARLPDADAKQIAPLLSPSNCAVSVPMTLLTASGGAVLLFFLFLSLLIIASGDGRSTEILSGLTFTTPVFWMVAYTGYRIFAAPRRALRRINTDAVTQGEIEAFLSTARGDLDRVYLNTLLDSMRQTVPDAARGDLRAALRAVGDTVSVLPGEPLAAEKGDPGALRAEAARLRAQAGSEPDSLVAESLRRQADGAEKNAEILAHSGAAAGRARARRGEAQEHLDTLRTVLTVYGSPENEARLRQGAATHDALRRVGQEATAAAQAKRELDDSEIAALYGRQVPAAEPMPVAAGGRGAGAGKWWSGGNGG